MWATALVKSAFRDFHVAAPLKRGNLHRSPMLGQSFRDFHVAAPLKRVAALACAGV